MTIKAKVTSIKTDFEGLQLPKDHAYRGRAFEQVLSALGNPVTAGAGPDYPKHDLEVKTKDKKSKSSNSIGSMTADNIINTSYKDSTIARKLKQQLRVTTVDGVVVASEIYDFADPYIQSKLEQAYEAGRAKMAAGIRDNYIYGSEYGYFERKTNSENSWAYRIPVGAMKKLEGMAKSSLQLDKMFEIA